MTELIRRCFEKKTLWLIRKGHMGDVILTEPIARALRQDYDNLILFTDYVNVGKLLEAYDEVREFSQLETLQASCNIEKLILAYELHPALHYLDGFAECAGITLRDRMPRLAGGDERIVGSDYV